MVAAAPPGADASTNGETEPAEASTESTPPPEPSTEVLAEPVLLFIGDTGGDGVSLRSDCSVEARADGGLLEGDEVLVEERGIGSCAGWSVVRAGEVTTWVEDQYLVAEQPVALRIVTALASRLDEPFESVAYEFCIEYDEGGVVGAVCRTFPTVPRVLWMPADIERYGAISDDLLQFFVDCYTNPPAVGEVVESCAFEPFES